MKGCPYGNAVAEAMFNVVKMELIKQMRFEDQQQLDLELDDYVNWYNKIRIHVTLNYLTPIEYRMAAIWSRYRARGIATLQ